MSLELFESDPRDYAFSLIDDGLVDAKVLADMLLPWLSHDQVRDALRDNGLDPDSKDLWAWVAKARA